MAPSSTMDPLTVARWLVHERGFSVIPADHPDETSQTDPKRIGKVPAIPSWKAFQEARPTDDNLQLWFGQGRLRNVAIVTGAISGIVVVDCDSPEAIAWADARLPVTPMRTKTAKGEHRFYRHPGGTIRNTVRIRTSDARIHLDLRADGGYVLGPSSRHATGAIYEDLGSWPPVEQLPAFDPAWIESDMPDPTVAHTPPMRSSRTSTPDEATSRARAYLNEIPPAVEGAGGDHHTYVVACRLVRDFGLAEQEALDLFRAWNVRCVPPWTDTDLQAKLDHARRYGNGLIGAKLDEPLPGRARSMSPMANGERTFHLTDVGNAEFFTAQYGQDVRYDHRRGRWLLWRGHRWQPDPDAEIRRLAKAAVRQRLTIATALEDSSARNLAVQSAIRSETRSRLDALLSLAEAELPIADAGDTWDQGPMLLGVPNGVIDLRTGALRDGRQDDRITMNAAVPFDPAASCPRWEQFVAEVFADDAELVSFVQRAVGYSLTGDTTAQCLFLLYGAGSNGKSTFTKTLLSLLGDYAYNMPFSTIELHQRAAIPNDMAALGGRRFVVASETNDGVRLNEARIKALTGCDPITARFLHQEFFTFEPLAKYWLSVNHKPVVRDDSHEFWRRMRLIPFTQRFAINPILADELRAEAPGILAWAVRGCLAWQQQGLEPPAVVRDATRDYERDSDPLAEFLEDACELDPDSQITAKEFYAHYQAWADQRGLNDRGERFSSTLFGRKMSERFKKIRAECGISYVGVARVSVNP